MMTNIEEQLASGDPELMKKIAIQLEGRLAICRQQLSHGAAPEQYKQWQQEANAIQAAQLIFYKLKGTR